MGTIIVKKAIVHILNNKEDKLTLTDFELELSDKVSALFIKHIINSQRHDKRRIAKFNNGKNVVKDCCIDMFTEGNFIENSKFLARQLFDSMNKSVSPTNLVICYYENNNDDEIAILKMDFNDSYITKTKLINGKTKIEIEIQNALPGKNDKLQKCAFIDKSIIEEGSDVGKNHSIILLDKQSNEEISDFFSKDFLHCEPLNTDRSNTANFIKEFNSIIQEIYCDNQPRLKDVHERMHRLLKDKSGNNIDVPEVVKNIIEDEVAINHILTKLNDNKKIDFEFIIDEEYLNKRYNKVVINTDKDIIIQCNWSQFQNHDIVKISSLGDGDTVDITIKNVKMYIK